MKYEISKELFEAIMDNSYEFFEIGYCNIFEQYTIYFGGIIDDEVCNSISVDTFFFKCKEWAKAKGYLIFSSQDRTCYIDGRILIDGKNIYFYSTSEQQAVFDCCMQILEWSQNNK